MQTRHVLNHILVNNVVLNVHNSDPVVSENRYQTVFRISLLLFSGLLVVCIALLFPTKIVQKKGHLSEYRQASALGSTACY